MICSLFFGHRKKNGFLPLHSRFFQIRRAHLARKPRYHIKDRLHIAHLFNAVELRKQVFERELVFRHLFLQVLGFFEVDGLLRFFNERNNIAHAQNAACNALWVERLKILSLFASTDEQNRLACNRLERKSRTTARVGIELGENNARNAELLVESLCDVNSVLSCH